MSDVLFIQRAIDLAEQHMAAGHGGPFGAVVVKNNHIIAEGWNSVTSLNDPTAHAEIVAIRNACQTLQTFTLAGCVIYTSCEPCPMCLSAIYWARIEHIYFAANKNDAAKIGFDDAFIYSEIAKPVAERQVPATQLLRQQALIPFARWETKIDKKPY